MRCPGQHWTALRHHSGETALIFQPRYSPKDVLCDRVQWTGRRKQLQVLLVYSKETGYPAFLTLLYQNLFTFRLIRRTMLSPCGAMRFRRAWMPCYPWVTSVIQDGLSQRLGHHSLAYPVERGSLAQCSAEIGFELLFRSSDLVSHVTTDCVPLLLALEYLSDRDVRDVNIVSGNARNRKDVHILFLFSLLYDYVCQLTVEIVPSGTSLDVIADVCFIHRGAS